MLVYQACVRLFNAIILTISKSYDSNQTEKLFEVGRVTKEMF